MRTKAVRPGAAHRALRLQHRRHTGKLLHHRHTSYRGLTIVLVLSAGMIIILNVMARVTADSLYVYARIPAPLPTHAAVITEPAGSSITHDANQLVRGTCQILQPRLVIVIMDNGSEAGSTTCTDNGTFQLYLNLVDGLNTLVAKSYTITDDTGPDSAPVNVTYDPYSPQRDAPPLVLTIDEPFVIFGPARDAVWDGTISGGYPPFRFRIDWGDNTSTAYTTPVRGKQHIRHHYRVMQPQDITIRVSDNSGQYLTRHYVAVTPYVPPAAATLLTGAPRTPFGGSTMLGIYGAYLILLAMFGSLWVRAHPFAYATVPIHRPAGVKSRKHSSRGRR